MKNNEVKKPQKIVSIVKTETYHKSRKKNTSGKNDKNDDKTMRELDDNQQQKFFDFKAHFKYIDLVKALNDLIIKENNLEHKGSERFKANGIFTKKTISRNRQQNKKEEYLELMKNENGENYIEFSYITNDLKKNKTCISPQNKFLFHNRIKNKEKNSKPKDKSKIKYNNLVTISLFKKEGYPNSIINLNSSKNRRNESNFKKDYNDYNLTRKHRDKSKKSNNNNHNKKKETNLNENNFNNKNSDMSEVKGLFGRRRPFASIKF